MTSANGGAAGANIYLEQSTRWMAKAACQDYPADLFFPHGDTVDVRRMTARAKVICAGCEVRVPCLRWARRTGQRAGIWGGLTAEER